MKFKKLICIGLFLCTVGSHAWSMEDELSPITNAIKQNNKNRFLYGLLSLGVAGATAYMTRQSIHTPSIKNLTLTGIGAISTLILSRLTYVAHSFLTIEKQLKTTRQETYFFYTRINRLKEDNRQKSILLDKCTVLDKKITKIIHQFPVWDESSIKRGLQKFLPKYTNLNNDITKEEKIESRIESRLDEETKLEEEIEQQKHNEKQKTDKKRKKYLALKKQQEEQKEQEKKNRKSSAIIQFNNKKFLVSQNVLNDCELYKSEKDYTKNAEKIDKKKSNPSKTREKWNITRGLNEILEWLPADKREKYLLKFITVARGNRPPEVDSYRGEKNLIYIATIADFFGNDTVVKKCKKEFWRKTFDYRPYQGNSIKGSDGSNLYVSPGKPYICGQCNEKTSVDEGAPLQKGKQYVSLSHPQCKCSDSADGKGVLIFYDLTSNNDDFFNNKTKIIKQYKDLDVKGIRIQKYNDKSFFVFTPHQVYCMDSTTGNIVNQISDVSINPKIDNSNICPTIKSILPLKDGLRCLVWYTTADGYINGICPIFLWDLTNNTFEPCYCEHTKEDGLGQISIGNVIQLSHNCMLSFTVDSANLKKKNFKLWNLTNGKTLAQLDLDRDLDRDDNA
jgi:hypothetical protein